MKPNTKFFEGLLAKMNCKNTKEMLLIGDELDKDIKLGMEQEVDTCWFNPKGIECQIYTPTYEIKQLEELKRIL